MLNQSLDGKRILVVEDEFHVAQSLCEELRALGAAIIGPAPSIGSALALMNNEINIDAALLDVNLGGSMAFPIAEALVVRSIPFIFTSGYDDSILAEHYALMPRCQKPADIISIARELNALFPSEEDIPPYR